MPFGVSIRPHNSLGLAGEYPLFRQFRAVAVIRYIAILSLNEPNDEIGQSGIIPVLLGAADTDDG